MKSCFNFCLQRLNSKKRQSYQYCTMIKEIAFFFTLPQLLFEPLLLLAQLLPLPVEFAPVGSKTLMSLSNHMVTCKLFTHLQFFLFCFGDCYFVPHLFQLSLYCAELLDFSLQFLMLFTLCINFIFQVLQSSKTSS